MSADFRGIIAGGEQAVFRSQEGVEDDESQGSAALKAQNLTAADAVVGIAASGRTPFVIGALKYAAEKNAATVSLSCVNNAHLSQYAAVPIEVVTGSEAIAGSTRLKAGTAQKMILNMLSTCIMIKMGKVMGNLMVDVQATNEKLQDRARRIVMTAASCTAKEAQAALDEAGGNAKAAIIARQNKARAEN